MKRTKQGARNLHKSMSKARRALNNRRPWLVDVAVDPLLIDVPQTPRPKPAPIDPVLPALEGYGDDRKWQLMRMEHPHGRPAEWVNVRVWQGDDFAEGLRLMDAQTYRTTLTKWGTKGRWFNHKPMRELPPTLTSGDDSSQG